MNLYVDHRGRIDIWALTPDERKLVGKHTHIVAFLRQQAKNVDNLLVIDRSPESNLTTLLLGKDTENDPIDSRELYKSREGYDIIWLPWSFDVAAEGYDSIITLNPPYAETVKDEENT